MAKTVEQERAAIEAEQARLQERLKALEEKERQMAIAAVERSGLLKAEPRKLTTILSRIKTLGIDEVHKRLAA